MAKVLDFCSMLVRQQFSRQTLNRQPEPSSLTEQHENVVQYDRVLGTKLAVAYAAGLMVVERARLSTGQGGSAIDLGCGPGHFTLCLARYLGFGRVLGIDLSAPMVEVGNRNAAEQGLEAAIQFRVGDITRLAEVPADEFDLSSFTQAAHHMPDLETVALILREMDRITKPGGLVMVMDLVRLRTATLTDRYVNTLGRDYVEQGLPSFLEDFRHSMYAAWTARELRGAIPSKTDRYWCHIVPWGLPTVQVILGLPVGRKRVFERSGVPWGPQAGPVSREMDLEWRLLRLSLSLASRRLYPPRNRGAQA